MSQPLPKALLDENLIAHYTRVETAVGHILPTNKLRFSALSQTNDPKENLERSIDIAYGGQNAERFEKIQHLASESYKKYTRISCFAKAKPGSSPYRYSFFRSRMWAQYAQNNEGVCLLFDRDLLFDTIKRQLNTESLILHDEIEYLDLEELYRLYPNDDLVTIDYERIKTLGVAAAIKENIVKYGPAFFRKDSDWSAEQEYRVLVFDPSCKGEYAYYDLNRALKAVILGTKFDPRRTLGIKEVLPAGIGLYRLLLHHGKYTVEPC